MMYWYIGISVLAIMLASLTGKIFTWRVFGAWLAPRLRLLVALAAGIFVIIIYGLVQESLHDGLTLPLAGAFVVGGLLLEVVTRLLPKGTHHHHGPHPEHHHNPIDARRMMLGDAVHNIHDGLTLVPAFLVSPVVGFGTTAGVLLHEMVQETAEFFVLREAGWPVNKALLWNFIVSATILFGVALSLLLVSVDPIAHLLVAFSAGGFTYVLLRDLLPSIVTHAKNEKRIVPYLGAFVLGLLIMLTVTIALPHDDHVEDVYPLPEGFGLA